MATQLNLFSNEKRITLDESIQLTIDKLNFHLRENDHAVIAFSGGKDSTTVVTLVCQLLAEGKITRPKSLTVCYADTRMELPPLQAGAMAVLKKVEDLGFKTKIAMAPMDKRFLVYILGRGVPPPNNSTMRWCTQQIKVNPMMRAIDAIRSELTESERILMLTGVRIGESAARDQIISMSCSRNGAECGQGWFQHQTEDRTDTLAPIDHWRVCHVWDYLYYLAPNDGFSTSLLAAVYGGDEAIEINARTGCTGCPLASEDKALKYLTKNPEWEYLNPLIELRGIYREMRNFSYRLQQPEPEVLKDGSLSKYGNRKGPLTLESRLMFLERILDVQRRVNKYATNYPVDIINTEEETRIRKLIALNTWPNGWKGTEPLGSDLIPQYYSDGSKQLILGI